MNRSHWELPGQLVPHGAGPRATRPNDSCEGHPTRVPIVNIQEIYCRPREGVKNNYH